MYKTLLQPRNIVICGSTKDKTGVLPKLEANVEQNFKGGIFWVRPEKKHAQSKKNYTAVGQILEDIDLAILQLPAVNLLETLRECGEQGVKAAVVLSTTKGQRKISGALRRQVAAVGTRYGMQILGPRSLGFIDNYGLNVSAMDFTRKGIFSLISTSSRRTGEIVKKVNQEDWGFSKIFTLGEAAGLTENELMLLLDQDKQTKAILLCLEKLADAKNFMRLVDMISQRKEVVIVPTGSVAGTKFTQGADFKRAAKKGALTTHNLDEFFNTLQAVAKANERISLLEKICPWC